MGPFLILSAGGSATGLSATGAHKCWRVTEEQRFRNNKVRRDVSYRRIFSVAIRCPRPDQFPNPRRCHDERSRLDSSLSLVSTAPDVRQIISPGQANSK